MLDKDEILVCERACNAMIARCIGRGYDCAATTYMFTPLEKLIERNTWLRDVLDAYRARRDAHPGVGEQTHPGRQTQAGERTCTSE